MKVKKWLLGLMTFAAMAVMCAVCAGAENEHTAYIMYADYDWFPSIMDYSGYYEDSYGDVTTWNSKTCDVSKSGTYTVSISDIKATIIDEETGEDLLEPVTGEGAVVFRVDIDDLSADFGLGSGSKGYDELKTAKEYMDFAKKNGADVTDVKITQVKDGKTTTVPVDMSKIHFGDLEGNGKFIIDIYNEYSDTKSDPPIDTNKINFDESLSVQFTITLPKAVQKPERSEYEYTVLEDGTVEITRYNGNDTDVVVPDKINGKSVTSIGDWAFYDCTSVTSIKLPNSVTNIGEGAFNDCTSLISVTIPDGVASIGDNAFSSCTNLASITIPNSVMEIGEFAFNDCTSLTSITIPNSVTRIGYRSFENCTSLISITIPDSVKSIEGSSFNNCTSLKSVMIPDSVTDIGLNAFSGCASLTSITIPSGVTSIGNGAFENCTSLTEIKVSTKNAKYVSVNGVLYNKNKTTLICYPVGKKDKNCTIIDGVASIDDYAFQNCTNLTSVTIPDGLTNIGDSAFEGCANLADIMIPDGLTNIGQLAFKDCIGLTTITIPDSVTSIGNFAFVDSGLTTVKLPEKLTDIGAGAFAGTPIIDNQKTEFKYIGSTIISCDTDAETLAIGDNITTIASYSISDYHHFSQCGSLKSITVPKSVKYIGDFAIGYYFVGEQGSLPFCKVDDFTIKCYNNSAAERYAKNSEIDYELLDKPTLSKVTGAKLTGRAADALRINWAKNASADGYIVEMYQNGKWARVGKITNNSTTTFRKAGLKAGTVYKFRVKAYKMSDKTAVYSAYSTELAARTNPSVMKGAKLGGRAADALRVNWTKNASADGYIVEMYQGNKWVRVGKITNNSTTTFRKSGLKASTVYKFRVKAYKMSGKTALYSAYSATVTARTNPSVMKGVKIGGKAKDALRVNWTKNTSAQGYIVEMYKGGKWVRVAKITNNSTTTFRKAGLAKNTAYKFRVRAYHMSGKIALYGNYGSVSGRTAAK